MADDETTPEEPATAADATTAEASVAPPAPPEPDAALGQTSSLHAGAGGRANMRKVREGWSCRPPWTRRRSSPSSTGCATPLRQDGAADQALYAHDEANDLRVGDRVRLAETRPLSKLKRWRVVEVLERAR